MRLNRIYGSRRKSQRKRSQRRFAAPDFSPERWSALQYLQPRPGDFPGAAAAANATTPAIVAPLGVPAT